MHKVKFILVGCGNIGIRHAALIHQFGTLLAVCDVDEARSTCVANQYQCAAFTNFNLLLQCNKEAQVLVICTPNGLHASQSIQGLFAGFHVLVEKPMALTSADCKAMINAAHQTGRQLMVVKQNRFNAPVLAIKQAIQQQLLGKIYSVHVNCLWHRDALYYQQSKWRGTVKLDGGILFTQFSHFIDVMLWLVNSDVQITSALSTNIAHQNCIEFEDTGLIQFQFDNGALGSMHYTINAFKENAEGSIWLMAEKGTIKIGGKYLENITYQCIENGTITYPATNTGANEYSGYKGSMQNHDKVYMHFLDILLHHQYPIITNEEAMKTVAFIESVYQHVCP
ncbi:MAG: Gfo/Idh/MocA family oxidoreductase [Bacteroidota bacterium]|jgi:predicted dehydrogenase|nr:Gfo/Idh/MocA family oxidoreductase [Bacteroidota bacterium]